MPHNDEYAIPKSRQSLFVAFEKVLFSSPRARIYSNTYFITPFELQVVLDANEANKNNTVPDRWKKDTTEQPIVDIKNIDKQL